jgi:hypothetical protein
MRVADDVEWDLSRMHDRDRARRLLRSLLPEDLIDQVAREVMDNKISIDATRTWQAGIDMAGCSRAIVVIPLTADTFDDLINGRNGYRAQYYLSVEEGRRLTASW